MVDSEDLGLLEDPVHDRVQLSRARQVVPEWLLDDDTGPVGATGTHGTDALDDYGKR